MSAEDIQRVMNFTFCTEEEAKTALAQTENIIDACDLLMQVPQTKGAPKQKQQTEEQKAFAQIRRHMEAIDMSITTKSNQRDSSSLELSHTHALVQEGTTLRSDCIQSSQIITLEEVEQKQETAYP